MIKATLYSLSIKIIIVFTIVTDTATDIDPAFAKEHNIKIVPTTVIFGKTEYRDSVEITRDVFLDRMARGEIASTSQPSLSDFDKVYSEAVEEDGNHAVLGIHISSKLSGTFNGACITQRSIEEGRIRLIDTENISLGAGYFVHLAVFIREKGCSLDEAVSILEETRSMVSTEIYVKDINYLKRSGRINLGIFTILKLFNLKPMIKIENGLLVKNGVVFGSKRAIRRMVKNLHTKQFSKPILFRGYSTKPDVFSTVESEIEKLDCSQNFFRGVGASILAHAGPGAAGVVFGPSFDTIYRNSFSD